MQKKEIKMEHKRDGSPKKYFTLSFDDGITQDKRVIEILRKHGVNCATFNINSGLLGVSWAWVGQRLKNPALTHIRFTEEELRSGIYDGFEISSHSLQHQSFKYLDNDPALFTHHVMADVYNLERIFGKAPIGMAWPGGDTEYTERSIEILRDYTPIKYARAANSHYRFTLPRRFLKWHPTCSIMSDSCLRLAKKFSEAECNEDMLFYAWTHSYELDNENAWDRLDKLLDIICSNKDIVLVTNGEFYELFKDDIPRWRK